MAAWFGREPKLRYLPWPQWKNEQSELEAAQTYDHIAHSPNCSIAKGERMLGYRPRYTSIEAVRESLNASTRIVRPPATTDFDARAKRANTRARSPRAAPAGWRAKREQAIVAPS
jgi:hypothetical protein